MRTFVRNIAMLTVTALLSLLSFGCVPQSQARRTDVPANSGSVVLLSLTPDSKVRKVVNATPFFLEVTQGRPHVEVRGSSAVRGEVSAVVEGNTLVIKTAGGKSRKWKWIGGSGDCRITVSLPDLQGVRSTGSGNIRINSCKISKLEVETYGSGDVSVGKLEASRLKLLSMGSGDIDIERASGSALEILLQGSGDAKLNGMRFDNSDIIVNGSGDVSAWNVDAGSVYVTVNGSGDVKLRGSGEKLHAVVNGSGDVFLRNFRSRKLSTVVRGSGEIITN